MMLKIDNLEAEINGKQILKGINLEVNAGEVHAIMGPNGSGKSTMSNVLVGHPAYQVTGGKATFKGKDLLSMSAEERSHEGLFYYAAFKCKYSNIFRYLCKEPESKPQSEPLLDVAS